MLVCYELLENLFYENAHKAISEIFRVSKSYATLSLPDTSRIYHFNLQIPKIGEIKKIIPLPRLRNLIHKFEDQHYWEIGKVGCPLSKIINDIQTAEFEIKKIYRVFEHPCHRFFILKRIKGR